jgi:hypothetical protein
MTVDELMGEEIVKAFQNPIQISQLQEGDIIERFRSNRPDGETWTVSDVSHNEWNSYCIHYKTNKWKHPKFFYAFGYENIVIRRDT